MLEVDMIFFLNRYPRRHPSLHRAARDGGLRVFPAVGIQGVQAPNAHDT